MTFAALAPRSTDRRARPTRSSLGVVVLPMHRGGTSVATRLVNLLGFSPGPADDLLPAHRDNPTGYWENASLVDMNDEILRALDGDWSRPPRLEEGWETRPEVDALRPTAAALVESVLSSERWVWKDPRNCLTLPFWLRVLEQEVATVLVYRNPLEVAASLHARDGFPVPVGLALWERYLRSRLAAVEGRPVCVLSYEQLVADPEGWSSRVSDFLRERGVETVPVTPDEISSAVRPELRHSSFSGASLRSSESVSPAQRAAYAAVEACSGTHDAFAAPELPPETPWVETLLDERRRQLHAAHTESALRAARARLADIESSRSYRMLRPLRAASDMLATARTRRAPG